MRSYEGTLTIEGVDYYMWIMGLEGRVFDFPEVPGYKTVLGDPEFHEDTDTLVQPWTHGDETLRQEIDMVEFWTWILEYLPISGDEILFDAPKWDAESKVLTVRYAGSNECHPSTWSKPPRFLLKVNPRRPYDDDQPDGYMESDIDFFENNREVAVELLERETK